MRNRDGSATKFIIGEKVIANGTGVLRKPGQSLYLATLPIGAVVTIVQGPWFWSGSTYWKVRYGRLDRMEELIAVEGWIIEEELAKKQAFQR